MTTGTTDAGSGTSHGGHDRPVQVPTQTATNQDRSKTHHRRTRPERTGQEASQVGLGVHPTRTHQPQTDATRPFDANGKATSVSTPHPSKRSPAGNRNAYSGIRPRQTAHGNTAKQTTVTIRIDLLETFAWEGSLPHVVTQHSRNLRVGWCPATPDRWSFRWYSVVR